MKLMQIFIKRLSKVSNITYTIWLLKQMLKPGGFLYESGWKSSIKFKMPVTKNGNPIPWYTYSFLEFFIPRLKPHFEIFEYGSGNSTIFYSQNGNKIVAVENNKLFYFLVKDKLGDNVNYILCEDIENEYANTINKLNKKFDIIVIDGRERVKCVFQAVKNLKHNGVIIFDNSLREKYKLGIDYLVNEGFKQIDFKGLNALGRFNTVTSLFYKSNNILEI